MRLPHLPHQTAKAPAAVGYHDETRLLYRSDAFAEARDCSAMQVANTRLVLSELIVDLQRRAWKEAKADVRKGLGLERGPKARA